MLLEYAPGGPASKTAHSECWPDPAQMSALAEGDAAKSRGCRVPPMTDFGRTGPPTGFRALATWKWEPPCCRRRGRSQWRPCRPADSSNPRGRVPRADILHRSGQHPSQARVGDDALIGRTPRRPLARRLFELPKSRPTVSIPSTRRGQRRRLRRRARATSRFRSTTCNDSEHAFMRNSNSDAPHSHDTYRPGDGTRSRKKTASGAKSSDSQPSQSLHSKRRFSCSNRPDGCMIQRIGRRGGQDRLWVPPWPLWGPRARWLREPRRHCT